MKALLTHRKIHRNISRTLAVLERLSQLVQLASKAIEQMEAKKYIPVLKVSDSIRTSGVNM